MKLHPQTRRNTILSHEGQLLNIAGSSGDEMAADLARCVADGALNALIRIEGAESASTFAFGLADRVAGGLREPTRLPLPSLSAHLDDEEDEVEEPGLTVKPTQPLNPLDNIPLWWIYLAPAIALFAGFVIGQGWPR